MPDPVRITYRSPEFSTKEHMLLSRKDLWHKFVLFNAATLDKNLILDALMNACDPNFLCPYMYTQEDNGNATFLTKCCGNTIQSFVMQGLTLNIPPDITLRFDIILGFVSTKELTVNSQFKLNHAVQNRYDPVKRVLNLDNFENDELIQPFYYPLSVNRALEKVLQSSKSKNTRETKFFVRKLSLASNRLKNVMGNIFLEKYFMATLVCLDLRYNCLQELVDLKFFADYKITDIYLDGNPLCNKYANQQDYVAAVINAFPHVEVIDGVTVRVTKTLTNIQTYYLGDGSRTNLVKQFVSHYFTLYDQPDRDVMQGIYDDCALYSMTVGILNYMPSQMMRRFITNRNLVKFVDYSKCHEYLLNDPDKIISTLRQQPPTIHNVRNMNIDIMHCGNHHFVICVQGFFVYKAIPNQPMFFSRTFVVVAKEDKEYRIANDMYHVASVAESKDIQVEPRSGNFVPNALSVPEKEQLISLFYKVSTMNRTFCKKFLERTHWDIRQAVSNFIRDYTLNDVPKEAFYNTFEFLE